MKRKVKWQQNIKCMWFVRKRFYMILKIMNIVYFFSFWFMKISLPVNYLLRGGIPFQLSFYIKKIFFLILFYLSFYNPVCNNVDYFSFNVITFNYKFYYCGSFPKHFTSLNYLICYYYLISTWVNFGRVTPYCILLYTYITKFFTRVYEYH